VLLTVATATAPPITARARTKAMASFFIEGSLFNCNCYSRRRACC
jgi:hypothetical protein